jgi:DNA-directed RNA polymerase subunit M/transcription elongation factor TFIIS
MQTLPQLNSTPKYEIVIPSTGKKVNYRPYLVKEEKVLMIAFETGDQKEALRAIVDTIKACVSEDLDEKTLTTFDVEYMFTQIRSKSVGEKSTIMMPCSECEVKNEVDVVISDITINVPKNENIIELTKDVSVEMQYPSYVSVLDVDLEQGESAVGFEMLMNCIVAILTPEERIDTSEVSKKDLNDFIEQMTTDQFEKVSNYLANMPSLEKDIEFDCVSCGHKNKQTLKGIGDFLS